jgi:hypothetical protein
MHDLERRISGDWIDLREAGKDKYTLIEHLNMEPQRLQRLAGELRWAVEEGLLEYKNVVLRRTFITLEAVQFQSVRFSELQAREEPLKDLLFVIMVQRLLCTGAIALPKARAGEPAGVDDIDINAVLADLRARIERDPAFRRHSAVKNVFMQVSIYQKERKKMAELLPTIKSEKRAVFQANFRTTFAKILDSIKKNYAAILREEELGRQERDSRQDLLAVVSLQELSPFLSTQAQNISRLRSTLAFTREDKYKTRSILVSLYRQKDEFLSLVEREHRVYRVLCSAAGAGGDCPLQLSSRLRDELVRVVELFARVEEKVP